MEVEVEQINKSVNPVESDTQTSIRLEWCGISVDAKPRKPTFTEKVRKCFQKKNKNFSVGTTEKISILKNGE